MTEVTRILSAIDAGDPHAPAQLWPRVYAELRKLAAGHMANEAPGHTLDATALVHEAYLRLVGARSVSEGFANRRHFFAAAARRKQAHKRGGPAGAARLALERIAAPAEEVDSWIDLDMALAEFDKID